MHPATPEFFTKKPANPNCIATCRQLPAVHSSEFFDVGGIFLGRNFPMLSEYEQERVDSILPQAPCLLLG